MSVAKNHGVQGLDSVVSQQLTLCLQVKLHRLLRYMKFRDIKASVSRTASVDEDEPAEHGRSL